MVSATNTKTSDNYNSDLTRDMQLRLRELWNEGTDHTRISASTIGYVLSQEYPDFRGSLGRNAILGHINRMRGKEEFKDWFPMRVVGGKRKDAKPKIKKPKAMTNLFPGNVVIKRKQETNDHPGRFRHLMKSGVPLPTPKENVIAAKKFADAMEKKFTAEGQTTKSLIDLGDHECRWPFTVKGETRFCGCPIVSTRFMYCAAHVNR